MSMPVRHLPIVQNWDCHTCGNCCREYQVYVTEEERQRIIAQGWDKDPEIGDLPLFTRVGPWWRRRYRLSDRGNGDCVFLTPDGLCRIHARFGAEAKPLACRLFPFMLIPADGQFRVGLRFACPSLAGDKGRPIIAHDNDLQHFAAELSRRDEAGKSTVPAPRLQVGQPAEWPDLRRFVDALLKILRNPRDRIELRLRKCLALTKLCRQSRFDQVKDGRLSEFLGIVASGLETDVSADPATLPPPGWIGRVLFRQFLAIHLRKDHGPERGPAMSSRLSLLRAAIRFARGTGPVPRMHRRMPEVTFEHVEQPAGPLPADAEEVLERYYVAKVASFQFFGMTNFWLSLWDGLASLALTYPMILWLSRAHAELPRRDAIIRALTLIDDHFGYNPMLGSLRQRLTLGILIRSGDLERLIAWYSR